MTADKIYRYKWRHPPYEALPVTHKKLELSNHWNTKQLRWQSGTCVANNVWWLHI